jgi:hypothetical protein
MRCDAEVAEVVVFLFSATHFLGESFGDDAGSRSCQSTATSRAYD